jgi:quercetin dioxygenase-like cupin family protein
MNLSELHSPEKTLSVKQLSDSIQTEAKAIQLTEGSILKEHITKVPAVLVCVLGEVTYEDENRHRQSLKPGDFISIEPNVKHWLEAVTSSQVLLLK